ncbi:MAG: hypothetical protein LAT75_06205 [Candidatus Cyclonatronum sp.]|uniref:hypothetical protein n=1 Tax=Cyclonatronum sp. TaxID=3024185 RepID=UPI0025C6AF8E|nr:hypothetical protein [Cyclonatronum sp.]MCC5934053.1 hypothetical protein [Balneolales bacterium]MCH8486440.1 hypothetical protein [Cyclonatronum sp.]
MISAAGTDQQVQPAFLVMCSLLSKGLEAITRKHKKKPAPVWMQALKLQKNGSE